MNVTDEWVTEMVDQFDQYERHYELSTGKLIFTERKEKAFELRYHSLKIEEEFNTTTISG